MYLDLSPLLFPVCEYSTYVMPTRLMNHPAFNVESRPLNCWNSVSTAQLVELTSDEFEILLQKTSTAHPARRQPGHRASTPEASSDTVGVGEQDEGGSGREVILIASWHGKSSKLLPRKAEEPSPSGSCNVVHVFYKNISRTSAVSSTNFGSILIFACCVVDACNILCG